MTDTFGRHSMLTRAIAVTLVAVMVLTMPGMTGWADNGQSPNIVSSSNNSSQQGQPKNYITGQHPNSYQPLVDNSANQVNELQNLAQQLTPGTDSNQFHHDPTIDVIGANINALPIVQGAERLSQQVQG